VGALIVVLCQGDQQFAQEGKGRSVCLDEHRLVVEQADVERVRLVEQFSEGLLR
jgi:hypothetical protein